MKDDLETKYPFDASRLPLPLGLGKTPDHIQRETLADIEGPFLQHALDAVAKKDIDSALQLLTRLDRLLGEYTSIGFSLLVPTQVQLQRTLVAINRVLRREIIRRILTGPEEDVPALMKLVKRDADLDGDLRVVERAVDRGEPLFEDLRDAPGVA